MQIRTIVVPTPFVVGPVNVYLLEDERHSEPLTIVDTGPKLPEALKAFEDGLSQYGYRLADVGQVVITHWHFEHCGLAGAVQAASGASIVASRHNAALLRDLRRAKDDRRSSLRPLLLRFGLPERQAEIAGAPDSAEGMADSILVDRPVDDGELVRAGGADWLVLDTPGHALGHICLYQKEAKVLLSGDHVVSETSSTPLLEPPANGGERPRCLLSYRESLRRTASLEVDLALPAHGQPIGNLRALIAQRLNAHQQRKEQIRRLLVSKGATTPYDLSRQLFPRQNEDATRVFLAISEVVGYLDLLELEGKATPELRGDLVHYSATTAS